MADAIYQNYKEFILAALLTDNIKIALVDLADYTFSQAHTFLSDVPVAARVALSPNLAGKTVTDGTFDHDAVTWLGVSGDTVEALIYYIDTGNAATSRIIAFLDASVTGFPLTPNGSDVTFTPDASGAFTL